MSSTSGQSTTPSCYNVGNGSVTSSDCCWNQVDDTNMLQNTMPPAWTQFPPHSNASVPGAYNECQYASSGGQSWSDQSALGIQITQTPGCNKRTGTVKKQKRIRTAFTTQQVLTLEEMYASNRYLERQRRIELSKQLDLNERTLKIWFQNRRMKEKKDREDSEATITSATPEFHEQQYLPASSYPPVMPASCPPSPMPSYIPPATQASWLPPAMPESYYSHAMSMPCQTDMVLAMSGYQQPSETEFVELAPEVPFPEPERHEPTPSGSNEDNDGDWSRLILSSLTFVD